MGGPIKHPKNVLRHKGIIKLADFGCSCLKESDNNTGAHGVTPYMDPRFYENQSYHDCALRLRILSSLSEEPMPNTETRMLYSSNCIRVKCWEQNQIIDRISIKLNLIIPENKNVSSFALKESGNADDDLYLLDRTGLE
ncbi:hypothetical protein GLOIN_2v1773319 [Rhizophagus irregularis DAOM 181602=DAOM 197198]|uniref:Protein kinase domain-containing protein n=1 Tax=Rhizophagus irregularis (strain DAOM 181602 / DAOM 197198 / MUCL 43194) TaxID=747089 RepID=A0A2P4Q4U9_RHIID|nr:hypothetical protein GLOIN_2v1773319 [Rhizophagus irregularis DAOM 181602=DAOM 197198]POG72677.1 hypothetical protein GLOIN_2v1773319 [Rhizophagus irregularis DAOM 181602=DAOM 197198]|eukprot:XP_025179543.1 hypothetical protein GLOIN_2v1773319 [Rhizophagus irregularis DAOM 181602=DAOM 197198]